MTLNKTKCLVNIKNNFQRNDCNSDMRFCYFEQCVLRQQDTKVSTPGRCFRTDCVARNITMKVRFAFVLFIDCRVSKLTKVKHFAAFLPASTLTQYFDYTPMELVICRSDASWTAVALPS